MSLSCTNCQKIFQSFKSLKQSSIEQAQTIFNLNIKNKNEQEISKKLLSKINSLTQSNNELRERLKSEMDKNEKLKIFENKCNAKEIELQNISEIKSVENKCNDCSISVSNTEDILVDKNNLLQELNLKLIKYETEMKELLSNIEIKDNYIKTLNKEGKNKNDILIENKKLILLNEELKCTIENIAKDCKNCQELKEKKLELLEANMKYEIEIKAFKKKVNDLDRELNEANAFNTKMQNENMKLSSKIDKYKSLQSGKVEELSRTVERLKQFISSDTEQRKREITKTCEICKVTANLIFDCFKGNESYRAVCSLNQKLLETYKHAKFTLLTHVHNNLISNMLTIDGKSDLLQSIKDIIENDDKNKSRQIPDKKVKVSETDYESSPSYMTEDSENENKINNFSGDNADKAESIETLLSDHNEIPTDKTDHNETRKKSKIHYQSSNRSNKTNNSNTKETLEIIALEISPKDIIRNPSKTYICQSSKKYQKIVTGQNIEQLCEQSSDSNLYINMDMISDGSTSVKNDFFYSDNRKNKGLESLTKNISSETIDHLDSDLKTPESVNNLEEFPESSKGFENISTPVCVDNEIEIIGTYLPKDISSCNSYSLYPIISKEIKAENYNDNSLISINQNISNQKHFYPKSTPENHFRMEFMKEESIDYESHPLNLTINSSPLNLSLKSNLFVTKTEFMEPNNLVDFPLNLSIKDLNQIKSISSSCISPKFHLNHVIPLTKHFEHTQSAIAVDKEHLESRQPVCSIRRKVISSLTVNEMTKISNSNFENCHKQFQNRLIAPKVILNSVHNEEEYLQENEHEIPNKSSNVDEQLKITRALVKPVPENVDKPKQTNAILKSLTNHCDGNLMDKENLIREKIMNCNKSDPKILQVNEKSVVREKRKRIKDVGPEIFSKKPKLCDISQISVNQYSVEIKSQKSPVNEFNISQYLRNKITDEEIERYQQMMSFSNTNSILPKISICTSDKIKCTSSKSHSPINQSEIDKTNCILRRVSLPKTDKIKCTSTNSHSPINQSKIDKSSLSNHLITNGKNILPKSPGKVKDVKSNENINRTLSNSTDQIAHNDENTKFIKYSPTKTLEKITNFDNLKNQANFNCQISIENIEQDKSINQNDLIERLFYNLIGQNEQDFNSQICRQMVIRTENEAKVYVDSYFNFFLFHKYKSLDRKLTINIAFYLILSMIRQWHKIYNYYYNNLLFTFKSRAGFKPILFLANISVLIFVQKWDLLLGFFIDLIRLPNISFLNIVKLITPDAVFPEPVRTKYSSIIDLFRKLVIYEYSTTKDNDCRKLFENSPLEVQRFWLNGQTTETIQPCNDITAIIELSNQIIVEHKFQKSKLKLENLDKDIEKKYFVK